MDFIVNNNSSNLSNSTKTTTTTRTLLVAEEIVANNDGDKINYELSPIAAALLTCSCIIAAVVISAIATYAIYKLTWSKNKKNIHKKAVSVLPSRRISKSVVHRQFTVLPANRQLYEGLTPERREILETLRSQGRKPGSAGFASRRAMSLVPIKEDGRKWDSPDSVDFLCVASADSQGEIADLPRRHSYMPPERQHGGLMLHDINEEVDSGK